MSQDRRANVNAALIHEVRMIVQSFLFTRSLSGPFTRPSKKKQPPATKCLLCLKRKTFDVAKDAIAVQDGNSVCEEHIS